MFIEPGLPEVYEQVAQVVAELVRRRPRVAISVGQGDSESNLQALRRNFTDRLGAPAVFVYGPDGAAEDPVRAGRRYEGDDSFHRKRLRDPAAWHDTVLPEIAVAGAAFALFGVRRVHVSGLMGHPMWFAVGRSLPEVRRWTITFDQRDHRWSTADSPEPIEARVMGTVDLGGGDDLAIGVTGNPTNDVERYLRSPNLRVRSLHALGSPDEASQTATSFGAWAMGWTRFAREIARRLVSETGATHVHLFWLYALVWGRRGSGAWRF